MNEQEFDEQRLIQLAESGKVIAMWLLAVKYDANSRSAREDKVGDVMTMEDLIKSLNAEEKDDPELKAKAYKYYRMAAEAGFPMAMTKVASWLYDGIAVEKNEEESKIWYRRGAEAGDPSAMRVVAFTSNDEVEKFKWYERSAELLEPGLNKQDSIKQTAINYAAGRGTEKNLEKAKEWLDKLDDQGAASARMEIAKITGENSWLEKAAETSPTAMVKMAENFVKQNDFKNALVWYEKASDAGDYEATSIIGDIYYVGENGIEQDYERAFEYYKRAAACDYNMAAIKLALMTYRGQGCDKDLRKAYTMFRKLVRSREKFFGVYRFNGTAKFYLAKMLEHGEGCRRNFNEAFTWYKRAAALEQMHKMESTHTVPEALYKVADTYFMQGNFAEAIPIYEKLAASRVRFEYPYNLEAAKKMMWIYELGEGVPQDKEKAAEWRKNVKVD